MEEEKKKQRKMLDRRSVLDGFSPISSTRIDWKSRKRSSEMVTYSPTASGRNIESKVTEDTANQTTPTKQEESPTDEKNRSESSEQPLVLSERRKALFEPLEPSTNFNSRRPSAESLLPPPDFDAAIYPKGWLIGKKRKLVNVDVVESMRRVAVQEMNRKDREIDGLNEQLEEDSRCLEHLQIQLLDEKAKNANLTRENTMLREQISMLMEMLQEEDETMGDGGPNEP